MKKYVGNLEQLEPFFGWGIGNNNAFAQHDRRPVALFSPFFCIYLRVRLPNKLGSQKRKPYKSPSPNKSNLFHPLFGRLLSSMLIGQMRLLRWLRSLLCPEIVCPSILPLSSHPSGWYLASII